MAVLQVPAPRCLLALLRSRRWYKPPPTPPPAPQNAPQLKDSQPQWKFGLPAWMQVEDERGQPVTQGDLAPSGAVQGQRAAGRVDCRGVLHGFLHGLLHAPGKGAAWVP